jgi:hypothetical protein
MKRVYLAGGLHGKSDEFVAWFHIAQVGLESMGYLVHNPLKFHDMRGREPSFGQIRRMVESDHNGVDWADTILCRPEGAGIGTGGEVYRAFKDRKYIVMWGPCSPSALYYATVTFPLLWDATEHLRSLVPKREKVPAVSYAEARADGLSVEDARRASGNYEAAW